MVQGRLKSWLMSGATAFSATLAIFYVAVIADSLRQPESLRAYPELDVRDNDRDWNHVNDWSPSLKDLYTMTTVIPESPSRGQLLKRRVEDTNR